MLFNHSTKEFVLQNAKFKNVYIKHKLDCLSFYVIVHYHYESSMLSIDQ